MKKIQDAVASKISGSGNVVAETVISKLADVEINNRVELIIGAVKKQDELEKNLRKINKNDIVTYSDGKEISAMSKERYDAIKKEEERLEKLSKLIEEALEKNLTDTFTKISDLLKK